MKLCRATPAGNAAGSDKCVGVASEFLSCYADMVKQSKAACSSELGNAIKCLNSNVGSDSQAAEGICEGSFTLFANCK